jgi:hypothetical protein
MEAPFFRPAAFEKQTPLFHEQGVREMSGDQADKIKSALFPERNKAD